MTVDVRYMLVALAMLPLMHAAAATPSPSSVDAAMATPPEKIAPYVSRFGRSRPVIAVLGECN